MRGLAVVVGEEVPHVLPDDVVRASDSTLQSTVSIEAAPNRISTWASRSAASKLA